MKKKVFGRKFSRSSMARKGLYRSLARSIVFYGSICTTSAKAKAVIPFFDSLITDARKETVASKRKVFAKIGNDKFTAKKIFELAKIFKDQKGGYLKATPLTRRLGDNAAMMKLELTKNTEAEKSKVILKKPAKKTQPVLKTKRTLKEKVSSVISRRKKT